jgi:hypothetical protein
MEERKEGRGGGREGGRLVLRNNICKIVEESRLSRGRS